LKAEGVVQSKREFWYEMDLEDIESAGAFIRKEMWDKFIIKNNKLRVGATQYASH
jgi:hypothetical protein